MARMSTTTTDFLDQKRREISERVSELRPLVEEFHRLEAAQRALEGVESNGSRQKARKRPKAGGKRLSTKRDIQALRLITKSPGITIPEMAKEMGIGPNYLYRVLPRLQSDGRVRKEGRGWYPAS